MLIPKNVQKKSKNRPFSDENHRKFVFNYSFCFSYVDTNLYGDKNKLGQNEHLVTFFSTNYLYQVLKINLAGPQLSRIIFNFECFISWFKTLWQRIDLVIFL